MKFKVGDKVKLKYPLNHGFSKSPVFEVTSSHSLYVFCIDGFGSPYFFKPFALELINE